MEKTKFDELIQLLEKKKKLLLQEIELNDKLIVIMKRHYYDPEFFTLDQGYKIWPFAMHPNDTRLDAAAAWHVQREDGEEKKYLAKDFPMELVSPRGWDHIGPHLRRAIERRQRNAKAR